MSARYLVGTVSDVDAGVAQTRVGSMCTTGGGASIGGAHALGQSVSGAALDLPGVGGICDLPIYRPGAVQISVVDDALGPVAFSWRAMDPQREPCGAEGTGVGLIEASLPTRCIFLSVFVHAPATTGLIAVS